MNNQKGFSTGAIIGIVAVVILGAVAFWSAGSRDTLKEDEAMMDPSASSGQEKKEGDAMMEEKEESAMMEKDGDAMSGKAGSGSAGMEDSTMMTSYGGAMLAGTKEAPLLDFTKADYDAAVKSDALVVLYFYANWCPICKVEFPLMQTAFNSLPKNSSVIGFRVNYKDSETDSAETALAKEFGVAYQHTKVFVKGGVKVLKAPDSWDTDRYLMEIAKAQ